MSPPVTRREMFAALMLPAWGNPPEEKSLQGIFPIAQTPFTPEDALDLEALAKEAVFLQRAGAHGAVWPQLASEWATLTDRERMEGAEVFAAAGRRARLAIVLGVQSPDPATAVKYARQAEKLGAQAIISLPPPDQNEPAALLDYYRTIGAATALPLFAQAVGKMSPELLLEMHRRIPSLRYVKDEAGQPLERIGTLREKSGDRLRVFSGAHGRTLIEELRRGFAGCMPAASFADLYARTWDLWQAGKRRQAMEMHGRTLLVLTDMSLYGLEGMKYVLALRGVFRTWRVRQEPGRGSPPGLTESGKRALGEALAFAKPYLKA